ncbi:hypothetical protein BX600DRAFT_469618 [Xylariales sp. PMI_506]|nr:hypothetical protein BX600DRAFT_469618 [Xylariales sp. PMI_506]
MGNPQEADSRPSVEYPLDPPPPYTATGAASTQEDAPPQPLSWQIPPAEKGKHRIFPDQFSLYIGSSGMRGTYMLGEHKDQPLYAVGISTWHQEVRLHSKPSYDSPLLAAIKRSGLKRSAVVTLPPVDGSGASKPTEEQTQMSGWTSGKLQFSTEVGAGNRREDFEWRRSHGDEVSALNGFGYGWKLARLTPGDAGPSSSSSSSAARSSDNKEVVAVWNYSKNSLTKAVKFQFLGSGASGQLQERFEVMAVITALRIWEEEMQEYLSSSK